MKQIAAAIIKVMQTVKGIEKNTTVGSGNYSYKGVSDKDVKEVYSKAMVDNGLCIIPIEVQDETKETTWMDGKKLKRSIFCKVTTKYKILHESGESEIISGYGHGIDSGDKAAGKATTYALKYALLYTFMTPTGKIDDSDNTHSEDIETAQKATPKKKAYPVENYDKGAKSLFEGKTTIEAIKKVYTLSEAAKEVLKEKVYKLADDKVPSEFEKTKEKTLSENDYNAQNTNI